jgi:Tol biopolymer transport system component
VLLDAGDAIGPYVIVASAGAGGMGEVYKARDTRLNRLVAIKLITNGFGDPPELRRRFVAEAQAIAALSHPHICGLYDTGRHEGRDFLVLEYLEGETLAQRLRRGPLPFRQVLGYAIEIADALHYAHRRGIVHRDLKPANVLITGTGGAKLLDFGLARLRAHAPPAEGVSTLTTEPLPITTRGGAVVGTLHYLAPERFDGCEADARSDVFAFGAVCYEMATGRRAFDEKTQARLIAAILSSDPPSLDAELELPPEFGWVVQHCLAKRPDERWESMGDVAKMLKAIARTDPRGAHVPARAARMWLYVVGSVLLGAALASAVAVQQFGRSTPRSRSPVTLSVLPPAGQAFALSESSIKSTQFALAPDGRMLAFVATANGSRQLWLRELGHPEPRPLEGTAGASYPFWSPDSQFIGFFAGEHLKKVALTGRAPQVLSDAMNGRGGAWRGDGTIVFSPDATAPLFRVSEVGGPAAPVTQLAAEHTGHRWPQILPDGRLLFFVQSGDPNVRGIYVTTLDSPETARRIKATTASAIYAEGQLLFVVDGELMAQPLSDDMFAATGEAVPVGFKVSASSTFQAAVSASREGVLATWSDTERSELVWIDRDGSRQGTAGPVDRYVDFRLSPDEQRLAVSRIDSATHTADLAMIDLRRAALTVLTSSPQTDASPVWSADGTRLLFRSNRRGLHDLFDRPAHGAGDDRFLYSAGFGIYPTDWSLDGLILFHMLGSSTKYDIWSLDPASRRVTAVLHTPALEAQGQIGPGRRLAYTSDESGRLQVYVRSLDGTQGPINVSVNGGFDPRWRADGRELFFVTPAGVLMAVDVAQGDRLQVGQAKAIFPTPIEEPSQPYLSQYVPTREGQRFLIKIPLVRAGLQPISVTLDWPDRVNAGVR